MAEYPKGPDRRVTSNILLTLIAILIAGVILRLARSVFIPVLIAAFLAYFMDPLVALLRRLRVPVVLAVIVAGVIFLGVSSVFSYFLYNNALEFARKISSYQRTFLAMLTDVMERFQHLTNDFFELRILDELKKIQIGSLVFSTLSSVANLVADFLLVLLFSLLILASKYTLTRKVLRSFPRREAKRLVLMLVHIDKDLRKYVGIKSFVSMIIGAASGITLALFHVEFAIILGFLTFALNFIPYLGSLFAVILPVLIALVQFASAGTALWILLVLVILQNLVAQLLEPTLVGSALKIPIPIVFFSLFFWGWFWGAPGVLLAIPIMTSLKIILEDIPGLRPIALLMEKGPRRRGYPRKKRRPADKPTNNDLTSPG
ncbi:MAG: AI-2E family transporter [Spirochaetales bacterium]|nr:AI-2E family transporter [Spirochaetales bacterium]